MRIQSGRSSAALPPCQARNGSVVYGTVPGSPGVSICMFWTAHSLTTVPSAHSKRSSQSPSRLKSNHTLTRAERYSGSTTVTLKSNVFHSQCVSVRVSRATPSSARSRFAASSGGRMLLDGSSSGPTSASCSSVTSSPRKANARGCKWIGPGAPVASR